MKRQMKKSRISAGYAEMPHEKLEHEHDGFIYCLPAPMINEGVSFDHVELVFLYFLRYQGLCKFVHNVFCFFGGIILS